MHHDDPRHRSPPRAEPLQPDRPERGSKKQDPSNAGTTPIIPPEAVPAGAEKQKQQSETALENVRDGFGRS